MPLNATWAMTALAFLIGLPLLHSSETFFALASISSVGLNLSCESLGTYLTLSHPQLKKSLGGGISISCLIASCPASLHSRVIHRLQSHDHKTLPIQCMEFACSPAYPRPILGCRARPQSRPCAPVALCHACPAPPNAMQSTFSKLPPVKGSKLPLQKSCATCAQAPCQLGLSQAYPDRTLCQQMCRDLS